MDFSGPAGRQGGGESGSPEAASAPPARTEIEATLERILASRSFAGSPRQQKLISYIVTETLEGRGDRLKEFTIAEAVFDQGPSFDPRLDSIVRVQASRLRAQLAEFYSPRTSTETVRIEVPPGSYVATFARIAPSQPKPALAPESEPPQPPRQPSAAKPAASPSAPAQWPMRPWLMLAILIPAALALGLLVFSALNHPSRQTADGRPSSPTIFVAQYALIDGPDYAHIFRNGLQFELIDSLYRFPELSVLGIDMVYGASSDAARNDSHGADFILSGSVQASPSEVRVTSQLIRTSDKTVVWSRSDTAAVTDPEALLGVQSRIAGGVAAELGQPYGVIQERLKEDLSSGRAVSLEDYLCVLQGYDYSRHKSAAQHATVRACLEQVTQHSPGYSPAWAKLSWLYGDEDRMEFNRRPGDPPPFERARAAAERAVAANASSAMAHQYLALALFALGDDRGAQTEIAEALRLNPNNSEILADAGTIEILQGDAERGIAHANKAIDLNPGHPPWYHQAIAVYYVVKGDAAAAKRSAEDGNDGSPMGAYALAAAFRLNGQPQKADETLNALYAQFPGLRDRQNDMIRSLRMPAKFAERVFGK